MTAAHTITQGASFDTALGTYDAVWVDQELGNVLTSAEITRLTDFVTSGGKLVLIGENDSWNPWNTSILSVVGGGFLPDCSWEVGTAISSHELVSGVTTVQDICGSLLTATGSPDILFDNDFAGVFSVGSGEALVILDSNWNDDAYLSSEDNALFAANIVDWLGTDQVVPEPSTIAIWSLLGLAGLGYGWRKRKTA